MTLGSLNRLRFSLKRAMLDYGIIYPRRGEIDLCLKEMEVLLILKI